MWYGTATTIEIQLFDGTEFDAELDGRIDRNTDIAVLKIDAEKELPVLPLANSDEGPSWTVRYCDREPISTRLYSNNRVPSVEKDVHFFPTSVLFAIKILSKRMLGLISEIAVVLY